MANVIDTVLATDGTEFRVVQRTAPTTGHTLYDVIDSNGTTYLDLPIENYTRALITAIFEQRSYDGKLETARIDAAVTIEDLEAVNPVKIQEDAIALGVKGNQDATINSIWMEANDGDLVLLNNTHVAVVVAVERGCVAITTSDILRKGYVGHVTGTLDGKEMAAVLFPMPVKLEVIIDKSLSYGQLEACRLLVKN